MPSTDCGSQAMPQLHPSPEGWFRAPHPLPPQPPLSTFPTTDASDAVMAEIPALKTSPTTTARATIESLLPWGDVDGHFAAAVAGDVHGLQLIYAAGFLLLRYTGQMDGSDYDILRRSLLRIAGVMGIEDLTSIVVPDLGSVVQRTS